MYRRKPDSVMSQLMELIMPIKRWSQDHLLITYTPRFPYSFKMTLKEYHKKRWNTKTTSWQAGLTPVIVRLRFGCIYGMMTSHPETCQNRFDSDVWLNSLPQQSTPTQHECIYANKLNAVSLKGSKLPKLSRLVYVVEVILFYML